MSKTTGRPKIYTEQDEPLKVSSVRLPFWHIRLAKKLGSGSISKGIRHALEVAFKSLKEPK